MWTRVTCIPTIPHYSAATGQPPEHAVHFLQNVPYASFHTIVPLPSTASCLLAGAEKHGSLCWELLSTPHDTWSPARADLLRLCVGRRPTASDSSGLKGAVPLAA